MHCQKPRASELVFVCYSPKKISWCQWSTHLGWARILWTKSSRHLWGHKRQVSGRGGKTNCLERGFLNAVETESFVTPPSQLVSHQLYCQAGLWNEGWGQVLRSSMVLSHALSILWVSDWLHGKTVDQDKKKKKIEHIKVPESFLQMKSDFGVSGIIYSYTSQVWRSGGVGRGLRAPPAHCCLDSLMPTCIASLLPLAHPNTVWKPLA